MNITVEHVINSGIFHKREVFILLDVNHKPLGYFNEDGLIDFYHLKVKYVDAVHNDLVIRLDEEYYEI